MCIVVLLLSCAVLCCAVQIVTGSYYTGPSMNPAVVSHQENQMHAFVQSCVNTDWLLCSVPCMLYAGRDAG
jgi:hypothetical protein